MDAFGRFKRFLLRREAENSRIGRARGGLPLPADPQRALAGSSELLGLIEGLGEVEAKGKLRAAFLSYSTVAVQESAGMPSGGKNRAASPAASVSLQVETLCSAIINIAESVPEIKKSHPYLFVKMNGILLDLVEIGERIGHHLVHRLAVSLDAEEMYSLSRILLQMDRQKVSGLKIRYLGLRRGEIVKGGFDEWRASSGESLGLDELSRAVNGEVERFCAVFSTDFPKKEEFLILSGFVFSLARLLLRGCSKNAIINALSALRRKTSAENEKPAEASAEESRPRIPPCISPSSVSSSSNGAEQKHTSTGASLVCHAVEEFLKFLFSSFEREQGLPDTDIFYL